MAHTGEVVWTFRRVTRADFPLIAGWLATPAVQRWWVQDASAQGVELDFGSTVDGEEPNEDLIAELDGEPVGLLQRSYVDAYPENAAAFASLPAPPQAVTIDYLIGVPGLLARGVGSSMIAAFADLTWREMPDAPAILVAVVAANVASWRALEKAGFARVGMADGTPENPIDPRKHYLYRLDRPA